MNTVLVTGGAGFIGSNFIRFFLHTNSKVRVVNLDKLTYAGNPENLTEVQSDPRYRFIRGDICNREFVEYLFCEHDIRGVIHFAAETHVDNSIAGPQVFIETNVKGTLTLLEAARSYWMDAPGRYREKYRNCRFHHISTDEVYGTLGRGDLFKETTPYAPNSPYSVSKASSDMLVRSYCRTYGLDTVTTNCSNNYGPKQHAEKLIPTIVRKALACETIPLYGRGDNIRDWLFVEDHCRAIDLVYRKGRAGDRYNIGGDNEKTNMEVALLICDLLDRWKPKTQGGSYKSQIAFVPDRPGHDFRYALDISKIEREIGWKPKEDFVSGLEKTVRWYLADSEKRLYRCQRGRIN